MVDAARQLLDSGGEKAVTLRAVGHACGVSHNAPYKHFTNRDALLAAVAIDDFAFLAGRFKRLRKSTRMPVEKLIGALEVGAGFSRDHPARFDLLFNNSTIAALEGELKPAAYGAFLEFVAIIEECQAAKILPDISGRTLATLLFSTMHGLIAAESTGRMHAEKGVDGVTHGVKILVQLLAPNR